MKKITTILVCITCALLWTARISAQLNAIEWSKKKKLTWEDFQGKPDSTSPQFAYTKYRIAHTYGSEGNGVLTSSVRCLFMKDKSWKKTGSNLTPELLKHEQQHFNIADIYAKKLKRQFDDYTSTHTQDDSTVADMAHIVQKILTDCDDYNDLYDKETDYGRNTTQQKKWKKKIKKQLRKR